MTYYVRMTDRSNAESERTGIQLGGLEFNAHDLDNPGVTWYEGKLLRGYAVVHLYGNVYQTQGPVFLTMDDLEAK